MKEILRIKKSKLTPWYIILAIDHQTVNNRYTYVHYIIFYNI